MRLQFFPWLFDDKSAWEKSFADPRYSYDAPIEYFMAIYQIERSAHPDSRPAGELAMPAMPMASLSLPMPAPTAYAPMEVQSFAAAVPTMAQAAPAQKEEPKEDGILSQDEIDALLSGL